VVSAGAAAEELALPAGADRGREGGATGVVAMTWISGRPVVFEAPLAPEDSCAEPVSGVSANATRIAQRQYIGRRFRTRTPRSIAPARRISNPPRTPGRILPPFPNGLSGKLLPMCPGRSGNRRCKRCLNVRGRYMRNPLISQRRKGGRVV
jgi:hypothetical protein